ncbi:MaoC family dehydratase N-terminal domain-containing protein [Nocardioides carbamazepini]|uniref:MaoC family dehydratase N-terminal domain-containing protein n=1 Tax=Nocardioides carbamazepini TaxID=2854259 RepID=UPI00214A830F|nr:MaoC family dehydratase N-terminal domain-containing protein [Nocardioides carbamazepini]MCR1784920.1 MaoC family dehydratase N-terminal domain-containing protein [Nocardioides carbamazepini]
MPLDRSVIGRATRGESLLISRSRLRFFAKATGQKDPVYTDLDAARAAGHRDLPVPPSFFTAIELESPDPFAWLDELGVDLRSILHGEQEFTYHRMAYAGDELRTRSKITDLYDKKGGALQFIVRRTEITNQAAEPVADAVSVTVVRQLSLT